MVPSNSLNYDDFRKLNSNKLKIRVLNVLYKHPNGITVDEIARIVGNNRSTIYNYLKYFRDSANMRELGFGDYILNKKRVHSKVYYYLKNIKELETKKVNIHDDDNLKLSINNHNNAIYSSINQTIKLNKSVNFTNFKHQIAEIIYGIFKGAKILPNYSSRNGNNRANLIIYTDLGTLEVNISKANNNSIDINLQVKWDNINYTLFNLIKDFNDLKVQIVNLYSEMINKIIHQIMNEKSKNNL